MTAIPKPDRVKISAAHRLVLRSSGAEQTKWTSTGFTLCRALLCIVMFVLCCQKSGRAQSVWGLKAGDRFTVETVFEQETTVQLDDGEPDTIRTRELLIVQYRVQGLRGPQAVIEAKILSSSLLDSEAESTSVNDSGAATEKLKQLVFTIAVNPDGVVEPVADFRSILRNLAGVDERVETSLRRLLSEQAFRTFVSLPFWAVRPPDSEDTEPVKWERVAETSLGPFGAIRHLVTVSSVGEQQLEVKAEHRHIVPPQAIAAFGEDLKMRDVTAEVTDYSGKVQLASDQDADTADTPEIAVPPRPRGRNSSPPFEEVSASVVIAGKATLVTGENKRTVSFRQKHQQTCRIREGGWLVTPRLPCSDSLPR